MTKIEVVLAIFLAGVGAKLGYLGLSVEMISALAVLVFLDIIVGIGAAYSIDKRSVKSSIGTSGVLKKIGIVILPFSLAYFGKASHVDVSIYINSCLGFLSAFELYSIWGNYISIRQGKRVAEIDALDILWTWFGKVIMSYLSLPEIPSSDKHFINSQKQPMTAETTNEEIPANGTEVTATTEPTEENVAPMTTPEMNETNPDAEPVKVNNPME